MFLATRAPFFVLDLDFLLFSCSECSQALGGLSDARRALAHFGRGQMMGAFIRCAREVA